MILSLFAALMLQEAPPSPPPPCPDSDRVQDLECHAQLDLSLGDHVGAASNFVAIADKATDPAAKARAYAAAAPLFALAGELTRADETAATALALNALPPLQQGWTMIDRAQALFRLNRAEEAEALWTRANPMIAEDPYYWWTGASMALEADRADKARIRVAEGLRRAKDSPELHLLAGQIALAQENEAAARRSFNAAIINGPEHRAGVAAARALQALGDE